MRRVLAITSMFAVLLVTGCGEGSGDRADAEIDVDTGSLSKTQFVAQASKICRGRMDEVDRKFAAYLKRNPDIGSLSRAELAAKAEEIVETIYLPAHDRRIDEVTSLGAPRGDEEQVAAILEALEKGLA